MSKQKKIPCWAKPPRHKGKVKATYKGWVDADTGEMLRRVNNLINRLKEIGLGPIESKPDLIEEVQQESKTIEESKLREPEKPKPVKSKKKPGPKPKKKKTKT